MKKAYKFALGAALALAVALIGGVIGHSIAAGGAGTADDPLITLSYLNEQFRPALEKSLTDKLDAAAEELKKTVDEAVAAYGGAQALPTDAEFLLVTVEKGKTIKLGAGAEALLRSGNATFAAPMSDLADMVEAAKDSEVRANRLYLSDGSGAIWAANACTFLVRGGYTIA